MTEKLARPDRRRVLRLAAGAAGGFAVPALVGAAAAPPITWKMAMAWPKDAKGVDASARRLAESIGAMSAGRFVVQPFAAGELVAPADLFDAVSGGTVEMGHGSSARWRDRDPAFDFFSGVPFGLFSHEHAGWLRFGGGQQLWERAYQPFGILPLYAGSFGILAAGWFRNPIAGPETVKDLAMRTDGLNGEIWRRLGARVANIPWDNVLSAFVDGKIDAAEWLGPRSTSDLALSTVAKNYYVPGFAGLGRAIELIINRAAYDTLPADLQAVVRTAAAAAAADTFADFAFSNITFLKPLTDAGVRVRALPDALVVAAGIEAQALLKEIAATSPMAGETYESFINFRSGAIAFGADGDGEALRMRALALTG